MQPAKQEPTPYPEVNRVLADLHLRVAAILGEQLVGMYLYGSLAVGGFEPSRSDIDFVVITQDRLPDQTIESLETMHLALVHSGKWYKKLEGAYVPKAIIRRHDSNQPPVPTINEAKFYMAPLGSDWVMQRHILRTSPTVVWGPPLDELIDPISPADLRAAVMEVIDHWWEPMLANPSRLQDPGYQPFAVLSMCRSLYTVTTGQLASKAEAANWALENLAAEWAALIQHARAWGDGDDIDSIEQTAAFMEYVIRLCRNSG
jgi:hypothetical protein